MQRDLPIAVLSAYILLVAGTASAAQGSAYDLNGDGRSEQVVGLAYFTDRGGNAARAVAVLPGDEKRLLGRPRLITQESLDIPTDERGSFGASVTAGDFDSDGHADLAIGVPGGGPRPEGNPFEAPGRVVIAYGSSSSVAGGRHEFVEAPQQAGGNSIRFGSELVAGDLNRDGFDDLVVTAGRDEPQFHLVFGGPVGLSDSGRRAFPRPPRARNRGGPNALALGDADADGHPDLFQANLGLPSYGDDGSPRPGYVTLAPGTGEGPQAANAFRPKLVGGARSLALGDVTGDGYADLVTGTRFEKYVNNDRARPRDYPSGIVRIWRGGPEGPSGKPIVLSEDTRGVPGRPQPSGGFGASVAVGRLDGDRFADIVIGSDGIRSPRTGAEGRVLVIRGARRGYAKDGHRALVPGRGALPGGRRTQAFGEIVSLLDYDGDGRLDLSVSERTREGVVTVLRGARKGFFTGKRARRFKLARLGFKQTDLGFLRLGRAGSS
jgi:hypothetical protein